MKKIKKTIALILALCLLSPAILLVACNKQKDGETSDAIFSSNLEQSENESEEIDFSDSSAEDSDDSIPDSSQSSASSGINSSSTNSSSANNSSSSGSGNNSSSSNNSSSNNNGNNNSSNNGTTTTPSTPSTSNTVSYIRCTGSNVNIRSGAGTSYQVLGSAEKGTMYAVIEQKNGWYKTYYRNQTAYLYASYASVFTLEKSEKDAVEDVIEEGYKLIGVPYVYGAVRLHDGKGNFLKGFTAQKFDCSSLMQYIFYQGAGTLLDTTTRTQVLQGKYVSKSNLQRGDCLFFTNEDRENNTGIERVGHVALYLGDNYILHTASDYARIEKISATRWSHFIEARRFL